jgi:steroid 5-alpha reductase family enzyme
MTHVSFQAAWQQLSALNLSWAGLTATPLAAAVTLLGAATLLCWLLQVTTGNYSWVDRLWSVMPPLYAWIFALGGGEPEPRLVLMAVLVTAWGARLTFNFARKGGYTPTEEDYRWPFVRDWLAKHDPLHPLGRELFSLLFIAIYQHLLIGLFIIPAMFVVHGLGRGEALGAGDAIAAIAFLVLLAGETVTDEQQWRFQRSKARLSPEERARAGGDLARGFLTTGVFRYSRHLNFFCEMSIWWVIGAFTWLAGAAAPHWAWVGPFLLTLLFQGSTVLTEALSARKYPAYRQYQRTTSRLVPLWPGEPLDPLPTRESPRTRQPD